MISIFKDYYDKNGSKYKVLSFNGEKYVCQNLSDGGIRCFSNYELFETKPEKKHVIRTVAIKVPRTSSVPDYKFGEDEETKPEKIKDKEDTEKSSDFYEDFMG